MTSLLREETPVPMAEAASATITSWPAIAAARATASPTMPAPTTRTCMPPARPSLRPNVGRIDQRPPEPAQQPPPPGRERGIERACPRRAPHEPQQKPAPGAAWPSDLRELARGIGAEVHDPIDCHHHAVIDAPAGGGMLGHQRRSVTGVDQRDVGSTS